MKKLKLNYVFIVLALLTALASCHKDNMAPATGLTAPGSIYVLSSGEQNAYTIDSATALNVPHYAPGSLMNYNFASKKLIADQYSMANGTPISGGTNLYIYGSKMYIISFGAITVVDGKTSKLINQVKINVHNVNYPTGVAFYKRNLFLSVGGITVYDTTTLAVTKTINGFGGAGLAVANGKLFVADPNNMNSTVSAIDLATLSLDATVYNAIPETITMAAGGNGNVYALSPFDDDDGNTFGYDGGLSIINSNTNTVSVSQTQGTLHNFTLAAQGNFAYFFNSLNQLIAYNSTTHTCAAFVTDGTSFVNPTCIAANPATGEVYVGDAKNFISNGTLYAFDKTAKLEYALTTGIGPTQIVLAN
jgi:VCBS repeat-containing protein